MEYLMKGSVAGAATKDLGQGHRTHYDARIPIPSRRQQRLDSPIRPRRLDDPLRVEYDRAA
jgi:hypothetical protein